MALQIATGTNVTLGAAGLVIPIGNNVKVVWVNIANNQLAGTGVTVLITPGSGKPFPVPAGGTESFPFSNVSFIKLTGQGASINYEIGDTRVDVFPSASAVSFSSPPAPAATGYEKEIDATSAGFQVRSAPCVLRGWYIFNPNASVSYVQIFDQPLNVVVVGTTVPNYVFGIPANSGANVLDSAGINFTLGMNVAATTTTTGSTSPANKVVVNFFFG